MTPSTVRALRAVAAAGSSDIHLLAGRAADEIETLQKGQDARRHVPTDPKLLEALKRRAREALPDTAPLSMCIEGEAAERIEELERVIAEETR